MNNYCEPSIARIISVFKSLFVFLLLFLPYTLHAAPKLIDDFKSPNWYDPDGTWKRNSIITWSSGRLRVQSSADATKRPMAFCTRSFPEQFWQNVTSVRIWAYLLTPTNINDSVIKLELKNVTRIPAGSNNIIPSIQSSTVTYNAWKDMEWDINISTPVEWIYFVPDNLTNAGIYTYYFEDLRLILQDGTTRYWDTFSTPSTGSWSFGNSGCALEWSTYEPGVYTTRKATSTEYPDGCAYLSWQYDKNAGVGNRYADKYAHIILSSSRSWANYDSIRADAWCTDASVPIRPFFWNNALATGAESNNYEYVNSTGTWQTLYWTLPSFATSYAIHQFQLGIIPDELHASGTCYFDNIYIGKNITVTKSMSPSSAKPGEDITITNTYSNPDDVAVTADITEAVPFNTYISKAATPGAGYTVKYYVNSEWITTYNESATKILWHFDSLAAGASGSVSYEVKVR